MFKRKLLLSTTIVLVFLSVSCTEYTVVPLTWDLPPNPLYHHYPEINDNGWIVWHTSVSNLFGPYSISLFDGTRKTQIAEGSCFAPDINNTGWIVWCGSDGGGDYEIFLYDGTSTTQITENDYSDVTPQIADNGYVVWYGCDGGTGLGCTGGDWEIFLYDGATITQLTNNFVDTEYFQANDHGPPCTFLWRT